MTSSTKIHDETARNRALGHLAAADAKAARLAQIDPFLIDLSLRENPVGARVGQTLADKIAIFPRLREFGFRNILLGTLDYSYPDELEPDDQFMKHLRDTGADVSGCYAFTAMGLVGPDGAFVPDPSMIKLRDYRVPNTLHEIYLSSWGMEGQYTFEQLLKSLPQSIEWLRRHAHSKEIIINIVDGCDAFAEYPERVLYVLETLHGRVEGVSFEDDRGTFLPFQVGAFAAAARAFLPPPMKLLFHLHAGAGYENAAAMEALVNGADGIWGGLPKRAAIIGHASLGELIANLTRLGNRNMEHYRLDRLLPLATTLQILDEEQSVPDDLPVLGHNAYRLPLSFFKQIEGRPFDLPPERIGGRYRYRVCPVVSDIHVIAGRLAEITGRPAESFPEKLLERMIKLIRDDLRAGQRIIYDAPANLLELLRRAEAP